MYGKVGVRKSWLVQHMAFSISLGLPWLGFHTIQARTLLVNFEISPIMYHSRLRAMAQVFTLEEQMLFEYSPNIMYLEDQTVFNRFADEIRPVAPQVIVLDCLSGCFGGMRIVHRR